MLLRVSLSLFIGSSSLMVGVVVVVLEEVRVARFLLSFSLGKGRAIIEGGH